MVTDADAPRRLRPRWPGCCEVCRRWCTQAVCNECVDRFAAPRPRCGHCALPLALDAPRCGRCISDPPPFGQCLCAVDYAFPWDRLITRMKFQQQPELALPLADLLAASVRSAGASMPDLLVPVPLSNERLAQRGYDQAWELARSLGRRLRLRTSRRMLLRRFDARHQLGLSRRERLSNLRGAFTVPTTARPCLEGACVGLVDDVMTTGATLVEAASALLSVGARQVVVWVVARTPDPPSAG